MPAINLPVPGAPPSKTLRYVAAAVNAAANDRTLVARQSSTTSFVAIPSAYGNQNDSPSPGVIVGIVLGSVVGFLLLLYLVYCILHGGLVLIPVRGGKSEAAPSTIGASTLGTSTLGTSTLGASSYGTRTTMSFRSRRDKSKDRRRRASSPPRRSRSRAEVVEVRTRSRRRTVDPVIVDPPRSPSPVSTAPPRVVPASEVSALSSFDEIVVEEEHSPPRRPGSRRYSPDRPGYRRDSYAPDPDRYYPQRDSPGRRGSRRY